MRSPEVDSVSASRQTSGVAATAKSQMARLDFLLAVCVETGDKGTSTSGNHVRFKDAGIKRPPSQRDGSLRRRDCEGDLCCFWRVSIVLWCRGSQLRCALMQTTSRIRIKHETSSLHFGTRIALNS
jgi:hypothetical protein